MHHNCHFNCDDAKKITKNTLHSRFYSRSNCNIAIFIKTGFQKTSNIYVNLLTTKLITNNLRHGIFFYCCLLTLTMLSQETFFTDHFRRASTFKNEFPETKQFYKMVSGNQYMTSLHLVNFLHTYIILCFGGEATVGVGGFQCKLSVVQTEFILNLKLHSPAPFLST